MKSKPVSRIGIFLSLLLVAGFARAEPLLNGLAVSSEFGKERFIAALYSDDLSSNAEDILNGSGERRMELKVTADSISARSVNGMWVEGMAINNSPGALEAQAENLAKLNNMVRRRLRAGDVLRFDASPGNGTTVLLNGIQLGRINSDDFFPMLLRTWIGNIPLSSDFKDALLANGDVDQALADRYAAIEPSDARVEAIAGWATPEPPRPSEESGLQPPRPDTRIAPPQPTVAVAAPPAEEAAAAPGTEAAAEPEAAAEAEQEVAAAPSESSSAPEPVTEPEPEIAEPRAEPEAPAQVAAAEAEPEPQPARDEDEVEEVMVTAESLLVRQRYISDVMRQTLQNMRYPRRAQQREQEGSIRLAVTLDRSGELQQVQIVSESEHSLLNREAEASVERASPFPELPASILGDSFSFGIPVTFRLQ